MTGARENDRGTVGDRGKIATGYCWREGVEMVRQGDGLD